MCLIPLLNAHRAKAIYISECLVRIYVERGRFLCSSWNLVDLITVLLGCLQLALAGTVNLSLLRLSRIVRVLSLATPELFFSSLP